MALAHKAPIAWAVLFILLQRPVSGEELSRQNAFQREGLHHVDIVGRVRDAAGHPLTGARVLIMPERLRGLPIKEALTDVNGRFHFKDVSSPNRLVGVIEPTSECMPAYFQVLGTSGRVVNVGEVSLARNTAIRAVVEIVSTKSIELRPQEITVLLKPKSRRNDGNNVVGQWDGRTYVFDHLTASKYELEVSYNRERKGWYFRTQLQVELGRQDRLLALRIYPETVTPKSEYHGEGRIDSVEMGFPPLQKPLRFPLSGLLRAPDKSPISGAIVYKDDTFRGPWQVSDSPTGPSGDFHLQLTPNDCSGFAVTLLGGGRRFLSPFGEGTDCRFPTDTEKPAEIVLTGTIPIELRLEGIDQKNASKLRLSWWQDDRGWLPLPSLRTWALPGFSRESPDVLATVPGFMPITGRLPLPERRADKDEILPEKIVFPVRFESTSRRQLEVRSGRLPLKDAVVDIERIDDLRTGRRVLLGAYRTGRDGRLELKGGGDNIYEVFVYASGHQPRRSVWSADQPLILNLALENAQLLLKGVEGTKYLRIKLADTQDVVSLLNLEEMNTDLVTLAPGSYDLTTLDEQGLVMRTVRAVLKPGVNQLPSPQTSQQPTIRVTFPRGEEWSVGVTHDTPSGTAFGWAVYSLLGGRSGSGEPAAEILAEEQGSVTLRLASPGSYQLLCSRKDLPYFLWKEVKAAVGEQLNENIPALGAVLSGSMRTYHGGKGQSHHGWAGPRLMLLPDNPKDWAVTIQMPERMADDRFEITQLPLGNYHVFQHLIGEMDSYTDDKGVRHEYPKARHAWGGVPVHLEAGQRGELKDFDQYGYASLRLRIMNRNGSPVSAATLFVRDRMSEAWQQVERGPTTLSNASDPIPMPPAVRVIHGAAELPNIRTGRLELTVVLDNGLVYQTSRNVDPARVLEIRIPEATR
jgi:hypothetical protein